MQSINNKCLVFKKMIKICNIILSYLEENQNPFLAQWEEKIVITENAN